MVWVSELPGARWPPCADVRLRWTRHLAFIYIYAPSTPAPDPHPPPPAPRLGAGKIQAPSSTRPQLLSKENIYSTRQPFNFGRVCVCVCVCVGAHVSSECVWAL